MNRLTRRDLLKTSAALMTGSAFSASLFSTGTATAQENNAATLSADVSGPFKYCLNFGTIRGYNLPLDQAIRAAAEAGYKSIEVWVRDIQQYADAGGSLDDIRKLNEDLGVTVENAIGFPRWAVDDDNIRAEALRQMRTEMELVMAIGGLRIAAPPSGINNIRMTNLDDIADRYREVLDLGRETGVQPLLEIWGSSKTLGRLCEAVYVTTAADDADASLLLDSYHLYKGGSGFEGLKQLNGAAMHVFHINDYPAEPPRETIGDADRIFPGEGICPLDDVLKTLYATGFRGAISLELFNRSYWENYPDAVSCAKAGLENMKKAVHSTFAS